MNCRWIKLKDVVEMLTVEDLHFSFRPIGGDFGRMPTAGVNE